MTEAIENSAIFLEKPSELGVSALKGLDVWLQKLCVFDAKQRPKASQALKDFEDLLGPAAGPIPPSESTPEPKVDYRNLLPRFVLRGKYSVENVLGKPGAFGVAYKVIDTFGDIARVMKIYAGRENIDERMRQEYQTLLRIPPHPNVVKVIDGDYLEGYGYPYIVFEYLEGADLKEQIETRALSLNDIFSLGAQVADGLAHLNENHAFHLDIKPANLLWTNAGVKIIDFNVAVLGGLPFPAVAERENIAA